MADQWERIGDDEDRQVDRQRQQPLEGRPGEPGANGELPGTGDPRHGGGAARAPPPAPPTDLPPYPPPNPPPPGSPPPARARASRGTRDTAVTAPSLVRLRCYPPPD